MNTHGTSGLPSLACGDGMLKGMKAPCVAVRDLVSAMSRRGPINWGVM